MRAFVRMTTGMILYMSRVSLNFEALSLAVVLVYENLHIYKVTLPPLAVNWVYYLNVGFESE